MELHSVGSETWGTSTVDAWRFLLNLY